jgi:hypothetical protein
MDQFLRTSNDVSNFALTDSSQDSIRGEKETDLEAGPLPRSKNASQLEKPPTPPRADQFYGSVFANSGGITGMTGSVSSAVVASHTRSYNPTAK